MNRIKISPLATDTLCEANPSANSPAQNALERKFGAATTADEFSLFVPMHYEKNYAYPLIVWLHSNEQNAAQIQKVMLDMSMRNYVGIAPQSAIGSSQAGYFWNQDLETIEMAHDSVLAAIDRASMRCNIASHRVFLAGSGAGGTMAFRLAFERPEIFAGVMSINGPLPAEQAPLRDWSRCRELPVFWAHGRGTEDFEQEQLCQQLTLLHVAGFSVTLRQYPRPDLLCQKTMSDMNHWLMEMISSAIVDPHRD